MQNALVLTAQSSGGGARGTNDLGWSENKNERFVLHLHSLESHCPMGAINNS